jgi:hypothetical protein
MNGAVNRLFATFKQDKTNHRPLGVAEKMKSGLEKFRPNLAIIRALCNPGLK